MIKVLIVDDHSSMRDALKGLFFDKSYQGEPYEVVGELTGADMALLYCDKLHPDLIFMDVCTEGNASGLMATRDILKKYPEIKIIVMTAFDEISYGPRAKEAGAKAFIYKSKSLSFFEEITNKVLEGESYFPEPKAIPLPQGEAPLTDRELEILRLVCKRMSNKEIGEELFISERTVKYHKENMLAKTGFPKIIDFAFYMMSNGWINPLY